MSGRLDPQWMTGNRIVCGDEVRVARQLWVVFKITNDDGKRMAELRGMLGRPNVNDVRKIELRHDEEVYVTKPSGFTRPGDPKWWEEGE